MQKKIGTLLDENLLKRAKQMAYRQHTTLNHIFEEALGEYLFRQIGSKEKLSSVELSFGVLQLPSAVVRRIAKEDIYATE